MVTDPLASLLELPDVAAAVGSARERADRALDHPALRRSGGRAAAEAGLRSARASAALDGSDHPLVDLRQGTVTEPVVQGALRVAGALPGLVDTWRRAPLQVLAKLHVLAARGLATDDSLGRPAGDAAVPARLSALASLVAGRTDPPAVVLAAVVHGELLALRPFATANGVVARGAARLTLMARGLDPRGLLVPEVGHLARQPEYVGAANAFATGTADGLRAWLKHCAAAVELGADEAARICAELVAGS